MCIISWDRSPATRSGGSNEPLQDQEQPEWQKRAGPRQNSLLVRRKGTKVPAWARFAKGYSRAVAASPGCGVPVFLALAGCLVGSGWPGNPLHCRHSPRRSDIAR